MHVEVARILTKWLAHEEYGVNALLTELPRNSFDGADAEPDPVDLYNDVDFEISDVSGVNPPTVPSIVVVVDSAPKSFDIRQPTKPARTMQSGAVAGIAYYAKSGYKPEEIVAGDYVLRAVVQSLARYNQPSRSRQFRELNGILLARIDQVETQRVAGAVPESSLMGLVFADLTVVDKLP